MGHAWVNVTYLTDAEYAAEVARAARLPDERHALKGAHGFGIDVASPQPRRHSWAGRWRYHSGAALARHWCSNRSARQVRHLPALEGWGPDKNGDTLILLGYYNRNKTQELDIPIGPDNRIEPGGPDFGQPTLLRRAPARRVRDQGAEGLRHAEAHVDADCERTDIVHLLLAEPAYWVNFYKHPANGNEPPSSSSSVTVPR